MSKSKIYTLECGAQVTWKQSDVFDNYRLEIVVPSPTSKGCGNPWNLMTEQETILIKSQKPKTAPVPCNLKSMMYQNIISDEKQLSNELQDMLGGDCWGVFVTTQDRKEIIKVYFDARTNGQDLKIHDNIRNDLLKDPNELVEHIKSGHTVVIVLGGNEFIEGYFFKIGDLFVEMVNDHMIRI
jgi:hypothetical protein